MALLWEMFYVRTKGSPFMFRFDCLSNSFDRGQSRWLNTSSFKQTQTNTRSFIRYKYRLEKRTPSSATNILEVELYSSHTELPLLEKLLACVMIRLTASGAQPYPANVVMNNFPISGSFPLE
ncbi:hypothetical protein T12_12925 [Trichinella patagoniensis]|uniref:Uncharacterized protein n=1 Tax=Trichinella patagoniensis TaxID=990121 RepID=A0A0V1A6S0_9BILA|nr:hypothetical protein T12_12925 [Trichinella patagoniensis]